MNLYYISFYLGIVCFIESLNSHGTFNVTSFNCAAFVVLDLELSKYSFSYDIQLYYE